MNILTIPVADIEVGDRLRAIDEDYAQLIAASMADHGQMMPIEVRLEYERYVLVTGAHRLRALQIAKIATAQAALFTGSKLEAELREIDENLVRHELTELDRGGFLARRKHVYEQLYPETRHGGKRQAGNFANLIARFTADAADRVHLSESTISRAIRRHNKLLPRTRNFVTGLWIADHGVALDALARLPPNLQVQVAEALRRFPGIRSVREAVAQVTGRREEPGDPLDQQYDAFLRLWRRLPPAVRERVRVFVEGDDA